MPVERMPPLARRAPHRREAERRPRCAALPCDARPPRRCERVLSALRRGLAELRRHPGSLMSLRFPLHLRCSRATTSAPRRLDVSLGERAPPGSPATSTSASPARASAVELGRDGEAHEWLERARRPPRAEPVRAHPRRAGAGECSRVAVSMPRRDALSRSAVALADASDTLNAQASAYADLGTVLHSQASPTRQPRRSRRRSTATSARGTS